MMEGSMPVAKFGRTGSYGLVAEQGDRIAGALNAAPWPRCQLSAGEKVKSAPIIVRAMGTALPRALKPTSVWAKREPKKPHWHIGPIGVDPAFQGQGVGKALLGPRDGRRGRSACLPRNRCRPERNALREVRIPGDSQADILAVCNRFMRRDVKPPVT